MGYRTYIASMTKVEYEKIKNFTKEELFKYKGETNDEYGHVGPYDIAENRLHELGKYVDVFPKSVFSPVFLNNDLQAYMEDERDFYMVNKEFLNLLIERYQGHIVDHYNKMATPFFGEGWNASEFLNSVTRTYDSAETQYSFDWSKITPEESTALFTALEHIRSMRTEWASLTPYDLNCGDEVTTSWKYEYVQFELVRIYKSFDWDNNIMIYYGY